ncbi:hypothetical protein LL01C2_19710 [Escherichia coli]
MHALLSLNNSTHLNICIGELYLTNEYIFAVNVIIELITPYFFFVFTDNGSVPTYRNAGEMSEHMKENK